MGSNGDGENKKEGKEMFKNRFGLVDCNFFAAMIQDIVVGTDDARL